MITFTIDDKAIKELDEWKEAIKKVFGSYGNYKYEFEPDSIGTAIKVYSSLSKTYLDLSHEENW